MDTVTRTFPIDLNNSYTASSIIELCHFRDMTFDADERVGIYLETWMCNLSLKGFALGIIPDFDGSESEIEKMAKFNAAEAKSQKVGLRILGRKNNTGDWKEKAEIILINRGRKDYFDLLQPYLAKNQIRILEKNDALAIQLIDYGNGLLTVNDSIGIEVGVTITISKKNNMDVFNARLAALELALENRLVNVPANTLLGRNSSIGTIEAISQSKFGTPAMIDQAIIDLVGGAPGALNTLIELAAALNNDAIFAATVTNLLNSKATLINPIFTGIINNSGGRIQFPVTEISSADPNCLDDYEEGTFTPVVIGLTTAGVGTYTTQSGTYTKIGRIVFFNIFVEWSSHTGTGEIRVSGLPFLFANSPISAVTIWYRNYTLTANNFLQGYVGGIPGAIGQIFFTQIPVGGGSVTAVNLDSAAGLIISGSYLAIV
jgi:hypothetical protein